MEIRDITGVGQIKKNDVLLVGGIEHFVIPALVRAVRFENTDQESIVLSTARNLVFSTQAYVRGESWVTECKQVINGKFFTISNTNVALPANPTCPKRVAAD
ncbi:MAG: hypothetical protein Q7S87_19335 [Agitococcus sp.]|nr:hypothetical protein [Agitococcus sp.]